MTLADSRKLKRIALRTALIYVVIAGLWIIASDKVLEALVSDPATMARLSIAKGWFFVVFTGALLFFGIRRQLRTIGSEVEARHRAALELQAERDRLDSIIEGTHSGTWEWNVETGVMVVNERWAEMLGRTLDELRPITFDTWTEMMHPEDRERIRRELEQHFAGATARFESEYRVRHRDGHWVWVLDCGRVLARTPTGRPHMLFGTRTDVTPRKQAELALRESEEIFRQIAHNTNEVFYITIGFIDESRVVYVSPAFDQIWGRPGDALIQGTLHWRDTVHPDDLAVIIERSPQKLAGGSVEETYRIIRPDGSIRWIHDRAFPIRDESGRMTRVVGMARDITEQRRLEHQLRESQKMQAIGTLAGGIAHDFNNLLGAIMGFAELSRLQLADRPDVRENVEDILAAGRRAIALVRQIMTFSRSSSGERVLMQLRPVVEEVIRLLRATIPTTIEIVCDARRGVPAVTADPTQVHQAIMNLGTNAWHAMRDQAGRLEVTVDCCTITAELAAGDARLREGRFSRICVRDTGTGMTPEVMERIFEPFFTTKAPGRGTGLGLSVVHGIMRDHDGFVSVESAPGKGSVFCLHFPAADAEAQTAVVETSEPPRGRGERILFVDDEGALVRLGVGMLDQLGYTADGAAGAGEALNELRGHPGRYALLITDQSMPEMSGLSVARAARALDPTLPIILVTGHGDELGGVSPAEHALSDLLRKPLSLATLGAAVQKALAENLTRR